MALNYFEKERIIICVVSGCTVLGIILSFVSGFTDYWMIITIPNAVFRNRSQAYVTGYHSGLWRICRSEVVNRTRVEIHSKYRNGRSEPSFYGWHINTLWEENLIPADNGCL